MGKTQRHGQDLAQVKVKTEYKIKTEFDTSASSSPADVSPRKSRKRSRRSSSSKSKKSHKRDKRDKTKKRRKNWWVF